ncbi:hypothetical protein F5J12DRAFT_914305 [Pisolithus orientalis]|uniref:uncharacterized protein n=1 Tax=Pisolithus orientalis TaxID=936130 RepID=UPI0022254F36|nr:uncharacterized protein F5J12DRAFT_914305 [Pisolithus orientalis]KAI6000346.1 hypothetical protein F5J12DRAFT_914305 [Pisolithus orientalis]
MVCGHDYESGTATWNNECDLGITTTQIVYEVTSIDYDCESAYATASNVNTDFYVATCINHQPLHFVALRALNATMPESFNAPPLFGDSTTNQAILFSPPFAFMTKSEPTYPNYTRPLADLSLPDAPPSPRRAVV